MGSKDFFYYGRRWKSVLPVLLQINPLFLICSGFVWQDAIEQLLIGILISLFGRDIHIQILILSSSKGVDLVIFLSTTVWILLDSDQVIVPAAVAIVTHLSSEGYGIRVGAFGRLLLPPQLTVARLAQPPSVVLGLVMVTILDLELRSSFDLWSLGFWTIRYFSNFKYFYRRLLLLDRVWIALYWRCLHFLFDLCIFDYLKYSLSLQVGSSYTFGILFKTKPRFPDVIFVLSALLDFFKWIYPFIYCF